MKKHNLLPSWRSLLSKAFGFALTFTTLTGTVSLSAPARADQAESHRLHHPIVENVARAPSLDKEGEQGSGKSGVRLQYQKLRPRPLEAGFSLIKGPAMSDPNVIENSEKIGIGSWPVYGYFSMFDAIESLNANWFYTWNGSLPDVAANGWTLGKGATPVLNGDWELSLGGTDGWAVQTFNIGGNTDFSLSFSATTPGDAKGGIFVDFLDAGGKSIDYAYLPIISGKTEYALLGDTASGVTSARLTAYAQNGTSFTVDDIALSVGGANSVSNGDFEKSYNLGIDFDLGFIPMVAKASDVANAATYVKAAPALLTFNEPDHYQQANMTVAEALKEWPALMALGVPLGSPATTMEGTLGANSWLNRFMTAADDKGYRVDFVAVHYYPDEASVEKFKSFLTQVHDAYDRPIWVTEWALADWSKPGKFSVEEQRSFFEAATQMMDDLPFVERHAWFGIYEGMDGWNLHSGLIDEAGDLTAVGEKFADLASHQAPQPEPLPEAENPIVWFESTADTDIFEGTEQQDIFFFEVSGNNTVDTIRFFDKDDLLATSAPLRDGNGDGIITFGSDKLLNLTDAGGDRIRIEGMDPKKGLRVLGEDDGKFYYGDATVRPKSTSERAVVEGSTADETLYAKSKPTSFFFDNAIALTSGSDTIKGFNQNSFLITTHQLADMDTKGVIQSGTDATFDLGSSDGRVAILDIGNSKVTALEYDGAAQHMGADYYFYSMVGSEIDVHAL